MYYSGELAIDSFGTLGGTPGLVTWVTYQGLKIAVTYFVDYKESYTPNIIIPNSHVNPVSTRVYIPVKER